MCLHCDWELFLEELEELEESGAAEWAQETLEGIAIWVEDNEHVTDGQWKALENIKGAAGA